MCYIMYIIVNIRNRIHVVCQVCLKYKYIAIKKIKYNKLIFLLYVI